MAKYFGAFPEYYYNGVVCKNITERTALSNQTLANTTAFYDYPLQEGERADVAAYKMYNDSFYDWMIYYANGIIDPYHGWYLDQSDFNNFITHKYGSIAQAQERTAFFRVNWVEDDRRKSVAEYGTLISSIKKFWKPEYDEAGREMYYVRSRQDTVMRTNKIVELALATAVSYTIGEHVTQRSGSAVTASGDVVRVSGNKVQVQHVMGTFTAAAMTGMSSDKVGTVADITELAFSIPLEEVPYWSPVSFYQYESELNEAKKNIRVLLPNVAKQVEQSHRELLA